MQTSGYTTDQALGVEGQLADAGLREVKSLVNSKATAIGYGLGVVDILDETFGEFDGAHKDIVGVVMLEHAADNAAETAASAPADRVASILRKGKVIVAVETAVTPGEDAYCRFDDGVADAAQLTKGKWGNDEDTNTRRHVRNAKFRSTAAKDALAILEIDMTREQFELASKMEDIGALAATTTVELGAVPVGRNIRLAQALLSAGQGAGDATDHWTVSIKSGSTELASWDSDVSVDGAITQNTYQALNKVASVVGKSGERLTAVFTKFNSGGNWSAGKLQLDLEIL